MISARHAPRTASTRRRAPPCAAWPALALSLAAACGAQAGRIEVRPDRTILHVTVANLPEPGRTDVGTRADRAVVRAFELRFAELMAPRIAR
ncbi:MAG: hypothetical protein KJ579_00180, partial [Verrucomicrobia bacterium]|nr:hypothetical protein [Verrucomicrobiota bacterium]